VRVQPPTASASPSLRSDRQCLRPDEPQEHVEELRAEYIGRRSRIAGVGSNQLDQWDLATVRRA